MGLIAINFLEFSVKGSVQRITKVNSSRIAGIAGENEPDISGVHTTTLQTNKDALTLHILRTLKCLGFEKQRILP